jgi:hypothetical protein
VTRRERGRHVKVIAGSLPATAAAMEKLCCAAVHRKRARHSAGKSVNKQEQNHSPLSIRYVQVGVQVER